jgi:ferrous iron transport protein A
MIKREGRLNTQRALNTVQRSPAGWSLKALSELKIGALAIVEALELPDEIGHHLMHMGFVPEAHVFVIRRAPAGDPTVYGIEGMEIALRGETARFIKVRPIEEGL